GLERRLDAGGGQDRLELLRLADVLGHGQLHHFAHPDASSTWGTGANSATPPGSWSSAPPFRRRGLPRSSNGISIVSKSFGTTVSGKTVRASRATWPPPYRLEMCVSASSCTPASRASSAAPIAVE